MRIRVDFPAPSGPSRPNTAPLVTSRSTESTAWVLPKLQLKERALITAGAAVGWDMGQFKVTSTGMPAFKVPLASSSLTRTS